MTEQSPNSGNRLDRWVDFYADRANNLRASEIRALFAVVSRPEVVSLAGGMPNLKDLPLHQIAESMKKLVETDGAQAMQYGSGQGWQPLAEKICELMALEEISGDPNQVVITTGSQQAVDLVTQIFVNAGDVVLCEAPSYVGSLGIFNAYQADVRHIEMDQDGLVPQALEETIKQVRKEGKPIKFLYTIPNFHNPAGVCLSRERRPEIVEICRREGILILEDNPYGLLAFDGQTYPSLQSMNPEGVIYLGSFSKIFAPGFRVGWALAPHGIKEKLVLASEAAILCPSMMAQMAIHRYMEEFDWKDQIVKFRSMYRGRRDAMLSALQEYLPQCDWTIPEGGFYTWVTLPEGIDAKSMLPRAVTGLVAYTSGTAFFADGQGGGHLRLSYCYPPEDVIREGVRRLAKVIDHEQELVRMFGTNVRLNQDRTVSNPAPNQP